MKSISKSPKLENFALLKVLTFWIDILDILTQSGPLKFLGSDSKLELSRHLIFLSENEHILPNSKLHVI